MSFRARLLNRWLRLVERPALTRLMSETPDRVRKRFRMNMWLIYGKPKRARATTIAGIPALVVGPDNGAAPILYLHGGGYVFGDPASYHGMCTRLAKTADRPVIIPDYPLAPEHFFPTAPEAALSIYQELRADGPVIIAGDSAGGGLALALLSLICTQNLPQPVATIALSPLTDLTFSGDSFVANAKVEAVLPPEGAKAAALGYLNGADPTDPRGSPVFGQFTGAAPVFLWVGSTEILRDDSRRMHERLQAQNVDVTLTEEDNLPHVWPMFADWQLPESAATMREIASAIQTSLDSASR